jgi:hypothetical protein
MVNSLRLDTRTIPFWGAPDEFFRPATFFFVVFVQNTRRSRQKFPLKSLFSDWMIEESESGPHSWIPRWDDGFLQQHGHLREKNWIKTESFPEKTKGMPVYFCSVITGEQERKVPVHNFVSVFGEDYSKKWSLKKEWSGERSGFQPQDTGCLRQPVESHFEAAN